MLQFSSVLLDQKSVQVICLLYDQLNIKHYSTILEERSMQTTDQTSQTEELQNTLGNNEVRLEEILVSKFVINIVSIVSGARENFEKEDI